MFIFKSKINGCATPSLSSLVSSFDFKNIVLMYLFPIIRVAQLYYVKT